MPPKDDGGEKEGEKKEKERARRRGGPRAQLTTADKTELSRRMSSEGTPSPARSRCSVCTLPLDDSGKCEHEHPTPSAASTVPTETPPPRTRAKLAPKVEAKKTASTATPRRNNQPVHPDETPSYVDLSRRIDHTIRCYITSDVINKLVRKQMHRSDACPADAETLTLKCGGPGEQFVRLENFGQLKSLRKLVASGHLFTKIENLQPVSSTLTHLDLSGNRITHISGISGLVKLNYLDLSGNLIERIPPTSTFPKTLEALRLNDNRLLCLDDLHHLRPFLQLMSLDLAGNPFTKHVHYRSVAVYAVLSVETLDGIEVTQAEREAAIYLWDRRSLKPLESELRASIEANKKLQAQLEEALQSECQKKGQLDAVCRLLELTQAEGAELKKERTITETALKEKEDSLSEMHMELLQTRSDLEFLKIELETMHPGAAEKLIAECRNTLGSPVSQRRTAPASFASIKGVAETDPTPPSTRPYNPRAADTTSSPFVQSDGSDLVRRLDLATSPPSPEVDRRQRAATPPPPPPPPEHPALAKYTAVPLGAPPAARADQPRSPPRSPSRTETPSPRPGSPPRRDEYRNYYVRGSPRNRGEGETVGHGYAELLRKEQGEHIVDIENIERQIDELRQHLHAKERRKDVLPGERGYATGDEHRVPPPPEEDRTRGREESTFRGTERTLPAPRTGTPPPPPLPEHRRVSPVRRPSSTTEYSGEGTSQLDVPPSEASTRSSNVARQFRRYIQKALHCERCAAAYRKKRIAEEAKCSAGHVLAEMEAVMPDLSSLLPDREDELLELATKHLKHYMDRARAYQAKMEECLASEQKYLSKARGLVPALMRNGEAFLPA